MKIKKNRLKRSYGEFIVKENRDDEKGGKLIETRKLEVYRWEGGELTLILDNGGAFIIKEKELIGGIKKLPKIV